MIVLIDIYNKYDKVLCHQNVVCLLYSNSNDSFPFYIRLFVSSITIGLLPNSRVHPQFLVRSVLLIS